MREIRFQLALGDKVIDVDRIEWRNGRPYRAGYFDKGFDKTHWFYLGGKLGYVLRESTGLKDKNGREIYERDIVRSMEYEEPSTFVVEWMQLINCGDCTNDSGIGFNLYLSQPNELEVVGNIYENPELLEAKS